MQEPLGYFNRFVPKAYKHKITYKNNYYIVYISYRITKYKIKQYFCYNIIIYYLIISNLCILFNNNKFDYFIDCLFITYKFITYKCKKRLSQNEFYKQNIDIFK